MQPVTFGQWVKKLRAEQDFTQEECSELVGCATPTLRSFEIGTRRPSRDMAERIADVLKVPADQRDKFLHLARQPLEVNPVETNAPAPLPPPPAAPTMPHAINPMIGREAERNALRSLLLDERQRMVTIVGAGGMGKTRLALDLTTGLQNHFAEGAGFVSLAAIQQSQHLPSTIANALNIPLQGAADLQQQVNEWLASRHMLLTLDNFEQLLTQTDAIQWVRQLLLSAPHVQLLITSRERLRLSGERSFELGGLSLPDSGQTIDQSDAVLLFLERAQQVNSTFVLNASNRAAISRICHLVGGMPLGVELAAAWVHVLPLEEIADEISRSIDFLARADRDMTPRHRSMKAAFDHSWNLLSEAERQVLMKLSVFRSGCTRDAAQQVAGATLPLLASLIDKSLLRKSQSIPTRYSIHELIRQYAADRLHLDLATEAATLASHALYYCNLVSSRTQSIQDHRQAESIAEIDADLDNVRIGWQWAINNRQVPLLLEMALAYWFYLDTKDFYQEGEESFRRARLAAQAHVQKATPAVSEDEQRANERLLAHMSTHEAYFVLRRVRLIEARTLLLPAITLLQKHKEITTLSMAQWHLGNTYWFHGDFADAIQNYREALAYSRQVGDLHRMLLMPMFIGGTLHEQGEYAEAQALLEEAVSGARRLAVPRLLTYGIWCLSRTARLLGQSERMIPLLHEGMQMTRATEDWFCVGLCLEELARIVFAEGDHERAQGMLKESIELHQRNGDKWSQSRALVALGDMHQQSGQQALAQQHLLNGLRIAYQSELLPHALDALTGFAQLFAEQGEPTRARSLVHSVMAHPATSHASRQRASQIEAGLAAQYPAAEPESTSFSAVVSELLMKYDRQKQ